MKLKYVYKEHPFCHSIAPEDLSTKMKNFWKSRELWSCDAALLAYEGEELIGFLRYDFDKADKMLYGVGTYITPSHRKQGLAFQMWSKVIKRCRPANISIVTTSKPAEFLVYKLMKTFSKITFY